MSDTVIIAAIGAVQVIMLAYIATLTRRTERNTNSLTTELVKTTAKASHSEGMSDQRDKTEAKGLIP